MSRPNLLGLFLDGMEPDLIDRWMADGAMPNLAALRADGVGRRLAMLRGFGSDAAWPSVHTGRDPSWHGRYYHRQEIMGEVDAHGSTFKDLRCDPIWVRLADAGQRVVTYDMPKAPLVAGRGGVTVSDYRAHSALAPDFASLPSDIAGDIARQFGPFELCPCFATRYTGIAANEIDHWVAKLRGRVADQVRVGQYLLAEHPADTFLMGFSAGHCASHQFWHAIDPDHPRHGETAGRRGNPVREVYAAVDRGIGAMIEAAGTPEQVLVFAGPGMGASYLRWDLLDEILARLDGGGAGGVRRLNRALKSVYRGLPGSLRNRLAAVAHRADRQLNARDRSNRRVYAARSNDSVGGVIVSLAGRQPDGQVDPADYDALCDELVREIGAIRNAETGTPIALDICKAADVYTGPGVGELPDVMIEWDQDRPVRRVASPRIGVIEQTRLPEWPGTHRANALAVLRAPGLSDDTWQARSVLDVAPTLAALAGVATDDEVERSMPVGLPDAGIADRPAR